MKVSVKVNPRTVVEVEGKSVKEVMDRLGPAEEVFAIDQCGLCGAGGLRHTVRHVDTYVYYELTCPNKDCRARLALGQTKDGLGLFVKRKDPDGNWLANGGWERYEGKQGTQSVRK